MRKWSWIVGAAALLAHAQAADADEYVRLVDVVGARTLERGKHEVTFTAPHAAGSRFFLTVERDGAIAHIELNGRIVVQPSDLAGPGGELERVEVELRANNVLRVHVAGRSGLTLRVQGVLPASGLPPGVGRPAAHMTLARHLFSGEVPPRVRLTAVGAPATEGLFTLRIEQAGTVPAITALLAWNGAPVLGTLPIRPGRSSVEGPVELRDGNALKTAVLGFRHSRVAVTLTGWAVDEVAPVVAFADLPAVIEPSTLLRATYADALSGVDVVRFVLDGAQDVTAAFVTGPTEATSTIAALTSLAPAIAAGTHTLTALVTDRAGLTAQASVSFAGDATPPVLSTPGDLTVEQTGPDGAVVSFVVTATDDRDASPLVECTPPAGSVFPAGTTAVTCTARDAAGNVATASFQVTVRDTTAPALTTPGDLVVEQASPSGVVVTFVAAASDYVDAAPTVECTPPSGSVFAAGTTTVTCAGRDAAGNVSTATFQVTVRDTTPPVLSTPGDLVIEQSSTVGAIATFVVTATDAVDPAPLVECTPPSGAVFVAGVTTVTCTARDAAGNASTATFSLTVQDTRSPALSLEPAEGTLVTVARVPVRLTFADSGSGVDTATILATLDGAPLLLTVIDGEATGVTEPLAPGEHVLAATLADRAGHRASALSRFQVALPELVTPDSLTFPWARASGGSSTTTLLVSNASDLVPLHVHGATTAGPFALEQPLPFGGLVVAPGSTVALVLRFSPFGLGPAAGALELASNDPREPLRVISLLGDGTRGELELTVDPGPAGALPAGSAHQVRVRAVDAEGALDTAFRGIVELRASGGSLLDGLLLSLDAAEQGEAATPPLPLFSAPGPHLITATLLDGQEPVALGELAVTVVEEVERGRVVCAVDPGAFAPGQELTARIFVDMGAPDGVPAALGDTLGAYDVRLLFDARRLEVVRVGPGTSVLGAPLFVLPGSLRLMGLNDVGTLTAPQGPSVAATGIQEVARIVLRVREGAPAGEAEFGVVADALTTAEPADTGTLALRPVGDPGPRPGEVEGTVTIVSAQPAPTILTLLGTVPRSGESLIAGVQRALAVRAILSEPVDESTLGAVSLSIDGFTPLEGTTRLGAAPNEVVFTPASPLGPGEYHFKLESGLRSLGGALLLAPRTSSFRLGPVPDAIAADLDRDGELAVLDVQARRDVVTGRTPGAVPDFPPVFLTGGPGTVTIGEGEDLEVVVHVVDLEGSTVFLGSDDLPPFSDLTRVSNTGFALTLHGSASSVLVLDASSTDGGTSAAQLEVVVERINRVPELVLEYPVQSALTPLRVREGEELFIDLFAIDPDLQAEIPDELTFTVLSPPVPNLSGPELVEGFALFEFYPTFQQAGRYPLVVRVTDRAGATDVIELEVEVVNVNRRPVLRSATASKETVVFREEDDAQVVALTFTGDDPDVGDVLTVGLKNFTESQLEALALQGAIRVLSRQSSQGSLVLVVEFDASFLDVGSLSFEAFVTDGLGFSDTDPRNTPRVSVVAADLSSQEVVPLVRTVVEEDHDEDEETPPIERILYKGVVELLEHGLTASGELRLLGAQSEAADDLTLSRVGGLLHVPLSFPGPPERPQLVLFDRIDLELEVDTDEGVFRRPVTLVEGPDQTPGSPQFVPQPLELLNVTGADEDLVRVRLRVFDPHLLRELKVVEGRILEDFVRSQAVDPRAPVEHELVITRSVSGDMIIRAHYRFTEETVEVSIPTTVPENTGVFVVTYRDGVLVPRSHVPLLPPGARAEDQVITRDNPYVFYVAYRLKGISAADLHIRASNAAEFLQFTPSLPLPTGSPSGPIHFEDGQQLSDYVISAPLFLVFRSAPSGSLTPYEVRGDRVVVNVPLPNTEFMGVPDDADFPPPGSPFLGLSPVFTADVRVLGRDRRTIETFDTFANGVAPHLVFDQDLIAVNDRPLDGAFVRCGETIRCWFAIGEGDFTLHLDDGEGDDRVVIPLAPTASDWTHLEFSVEDLLRALPQLTPGVHRVRLYPTDRRAIAMQPLAAPPSARPLLEATFEVVIGNRSLPFKTAPGAPAPACAGANPDDLEQRTVRQGDVALDDGISPCTPMAGGTVLLTTGEERLERVDLVIPGRAGLDFVLQRVYRSRHSYSGPLGHSWDFNWNEALFLPSDGVVVRKNGNSQISYWEPSQTPGRYHAPEGHFGVLVRLDERYVLRLPDGRKHVYSPGGVLEEIQDRHGNTVQLVHDRATGQLDYVLDTFGRKIDFTYARFEDASVEGGSVHRLTSVVDFAGREIVYTYDAAGDLVSVRSPEVSGQGGRTEFYEYYRVFPGELGKADLAHNLTGVTSPEEGEGGPKTQVITYGTNSLDSSTYDKVIEETVGGTNSSGLPAGGRRTFSYASLGDHKSVRVLEPDGNRHDHLIDGKGREVAVRQFSRANQRPGEPAFYETRSAYNESGLLVLRIHPEGNEERFVYGTGARGAQRDLVEHRRTPGPRGGGPDLVTRYAYEPVYNQLAAITEPRGNAPGYVPPVVGTAAGPDRYTTTFFFDYQESSGPIPDAARFGINTESYVSRQPTPLPRNLGHLNGDEVTGQTAGNVVRVVAPRVHLEAGGLQEVTTQTVWNDRGQPLRVVDPVGNSTELEYFPERDPDGDGIAVVGAGSAEGRGYLRRVTVDARKPGDRDPTLLSTSYEYDPVGNITAVTNPRGVKTELQVNELNEVTQIVRGAAVTEPGHTAPRLVTRRTYDLNGRVRTIETGDVDGPGVPAVTRQTFMYDLLGDVVESTVTVSATKSLTTRFRYDPNRRLIETTSPEGNVTRVEHDGRGLVFTITRGAGTALASTVQVNYDRNGNRIAVTDAADNDDDGQRETTAFAYDGFDRLTKATDPLGNETTLTLDPAGNVVQRRTIGGHPTLPATIKVLLEDVHLRHDELGRVFRTRAKLFVSTGFAFARPPVLEDADSDGFVSTKTLFDAASRPIATTNDAGRSTHMAYDGVSRLVEVTDPLENKVIRTYDANGNPLRVTSVEVSPEGLTAAESFETIYVHDALDRLVRATDAAGHTTELRYDSRDNLVFRSDPEGAPTVDPLGLFTKGPINGPGNTSSYVYDGLDRMTQQVSHLRGDGKGSGVVVGQITLTYTFDGDSRLVAVTDGNGKATTFGHDALDRRTSQKDADDAANGRPGYVFTYDADDNLHTITDPNGTVVTRKHDALNRLVDVLIARGPGVSGTTRETYSYDGLGRLVHAFGEDGPGTSGHGVDYVYDSLGRVLEERQDTRAISSRYTGDGQRVEVVYPGGRTLTQSFDALDRVKRIQDGPTEQGLVASFDWIGPGLRELRRTNGNATTLSFLKEPGDTHGGHDAVQRVVRQRVTSGNLRVVDRAYEYGRAGQRTLERRHDDSGLTDLYTYDSAYRLERSMFDQAGQPGAPRRETSQATYRLDDVGNRLQVDTVTTAGAATESYTVNDVNEYTRIGPPAAPPPAEPPPPNRAYDENGNLTDDGTSVYSYDYKNRLVEVSRPAGSQPILIATYQYLPDGRRSGKSALVESAPGVFEQTASAFFHDGPQEVEERNAATGRVVATYVWSPASVDDLVQFRREQDHSLGAGTFYAHHDARGNVVAITDHMGRLEEQIRYDDFGNMEVRDSTGQVLAQSAVGLEYGFQGRRLDPETGLMYFRARMYDPATGRFIQRDPVWDPVSMGNQYTAFGNNPATLMDPSGTIVWAPIIWGLAKLGGIALAGAGVGVGLNAVEQYGNTGSFSWDQSTTQDAGMGALMAIPGYGLVRGATMGYRAASIGVRVLGGVGIAGGGRHIGSGIAQGQWGTAARGGLEAGLGGLAFFARFGAPPLRSRSPGGSTGIPHYDRLAVDTPEFAGWKAAVERPGGNYGFKVEARTLAKGTAAEIEGSTLTYDPAQFRYIDLLHESRHLAQLRRLWFRDRSPVQDSVLEASAYRYELRLGSTQRFGPLSPSYQSWATARIGDYMDMPTRFALSTDPAMKAFMAELGSLGR